MSMHWTQWLPLAMQGDLDTATLLPLLKTLTPDALSEEAVLTLWQWLFEQLPVIPGMENIPKRFDTCGTGGSGLWHYNTSTTVALVLASMGIPVVKFGNRAATSRSGSFDFLTELGLGNPLPLDRIAPCLDAGNLAFVYAPQCLPGLKHLAAARNQLGQKTIFNLLGPLLNPCRPTHQLLGANTYYPWMHRLLASQTQSAWLVCGHGGQDDLTPWGVNHVYPVHQAIAGDSSVNLAETIVLKGTCPLPEANTPDDPAANVATCFAIIKGLDVTSPAYYLVRDNTAASLCIWRNQSVSSTGLPRDVVKEVDDHLASGQVFHHLQRLRDWYRVP